MLFTWLVSCDTKFLLLLSSEDSAATFLSRQTHRQSQLLPCCKHLPHAMNWVFVQRET